MPTSYTEGRHAGEFISSEAPGSRSREAVTIASGSGVCAPGLVLGQVTVGTISAAAGAGNTGNGTIGTVTAAAGIKPGVYTVVMIEPITNLGTYVLEDPIGITVGRGFVGTAFSGGHLAFTIADGATDFVAGDRFLITVAAGNLQYRPWDPANTDGSNVVAGILYDQVDATSAARRATALVRDCEVTSAELQWKTGITTPQQATGRAQLATLGVISR